MKVRRCASTPRCGFFVPLLWLFALFMPAWAGAQVGCPADAPCITLPGFTCGAVTFRFSNDGDWDHFNVRYPTPQGERQVTNESGEFTVSGPPGVPITVKVQGCSTGVLGSECSDWNSETAAPRNGPQTCPNGGPIRSGAGKCLDVHAPDQHNNGAVVQVWDCNGSPQQTWRVEGNAIRSAAGKCLDVHAPDQGTNGGKVQVWDCNGAPQQQWTIMSGGFEGLQGNVAIRSAANKCLDVHAPDQHTNGGRVQVWDCNDSLQQKWDAR